jgi:hypothetical protein
MSSHYIKLKDTVIKLTNEETEKIKELQLFTYDERFTFDNGEYNSIEEFWKGTEKDCLLKLDTFGDIKELFEVSKR